MAIQYTTVDQEVLVGNAAGDEKGKVFHLQYYPIKSFSSSLAKIYLRRGSSSDLELTEDTEIIVDTDEASIIFLFDFQ